MDPRTLLAVCLVCAVLCVLMLAWGIWDLDKRTDARLTRLEREARANDWRDPEDTIHLTGRKRQSWRVRVAIWLMRGQ